MPEKTVEKSPFVGRIPELKNKKWAGMENKDAAAVVADVLKAGKPAVTQVIDGLQELDDGSDWKERLLLHMLVTQTSVAERGKERAMVAGALVEAAAGDRPASVRAFLLQQVRLIGDRTTVSQLAPLLRDKDPLVLDAVTAAMVSIGKDAAKSLRAAMNGADGHAKTAIEHALNQLS